MPSPLQTTVVHGKFRTGALQVANLVNPGSPSCGTWYKYRLSTLTIPPLIAIGAARCVAQDIFQNGVSCQRMLWQCDRQHYWFLSYLPLDLTPIA